MNAETIGIYPAKLNPLENSVTKGGFTELWIGKHATKTQLVKLCDFFARTPLRTAMLASGVYGLCSASTSKDIRTLAEALGCDISSTPRNEVDDADPAINLPGELPNHVWSDIERLIGRSLDPAVVSEIAQAYLRDFAGTKLPESGYGSMIFTGLLTRDKKPLEIRIRSYATDRYAYHDDLSTLEQSVCFEVDSTDTPQVKSEAND